MQKLNDKTFYKHVYLCLLPDIKECSNVSVNCTTEKLCTETFGGYECTCANMSLYGDNCTKGGSLCVFCTYLAVYSEVMFRPMVVSDKR